MSFTNEALFRLLPALYRIRDAYVAGALPAGKLSPSRQAIINAALAAGEQPPGPLRELLAVITEQLAVLEENFEQLYDDQFIETCAEWAIPYIGDLVGARGLVTFPDAPFSPRAEVANTIMYRRRKGTASILEQLAHDITGWDSNVVEYFRLMATTQYLNHLRPSHRSMATVKGHTQPETIGTPFDESARTVEVRRIERGRGKYNIPDIGIYLWRIGSYALSRSPAFRVAGRRYTFDPLGRDTALYNRSIPEETVTHPATPANVSMPIQRRIMSDHPERYYGEDSGADIFSMLLHINGNALLPDLPNGEILSDILQVCNLEDEKDGGGNVIGWLNMPQDKISIDPVLGRIAFPSAQPPPATVEVSYRYGFPAQMGGGNYLRKNADRQDDLVLKVPSQHPTIQAALLQLGTDGGIIEIENNNYYIETPAIQVPAGKQITIRAAREKRPVWVLSGDMEVTGGAEAILVLEGLLLAGGCIRLPEVDSSGGPNELRTLHILHCTLAPGATPAIPPAPAQPAQPRIIGQSVTTAIVMDKSISGPLLVTEHTSVTLTNSIIDAGSDQGIAFAGPATTDTEHFPGAVLIAENCTIIGKVYTKMMQMVSNSILLASLKPADTWNTPVKVERLQEGCIRFSWYPPGATVPRPYQCQPATGKAGTVRPVFTSLRFGDAAYGQLSMHTAIEIRQGAEDGSEMGAYRHLYQPQREANLRVRINEYLRFGMEAGIFYGS